MKASAFLHSLHCIVSQLLINYWLQICQFLIIWIYIFLLVWIFSLKRNEHINLHMETCEMRIFNSVISHYIESWVKVFLHNICSVHICETSKASFSIINMHRKLEVQSRKLRVIYYSCWWLTISTLHIWITMWVAIYYLLQLLNGYEELKGTSADRLHGRKTKPRRNQSVDQSEYPIPLLLSSMWRNYLNLQPKTDEQLTSKLINVKYETP